MISIFKIVKNLLPLNREELDAVNYFLLTLKNMEGSKEDDRGSTAGNRLFAKFFRFGYR